MNKRREHVKTSQQMEIIGSAVRVMVNHPRNQEAWA